jgi:formyl-CoA transferase
MGAFGVLLALSRRERDPTFQGEWIDLTSFESLFRLIEWQVIVYDQLGRVPQRSDNQLPEFPDSVGNAYRTSDDDWLVIASGWRSVASLLGEPVEGEMREADIARFNSLLIEWVAKRTSAECQAAFADDNVIASSVFSVGDIMQDPTYAERQDVIDMRDPDLKLVRMQGVVPRLANHGGSVRRPAPALGQDNDLVLKEYLGLPDGEVNKLQAAGVV